MIDRKQAEEELLNWAYCNHDGWLAKHALYSIPPTSEQYRPESGDTWEPDPPAEIPLNFRSAARTERMVVEMGLEGAVGHERHCVLVYFYTRLMVAHLPHDGTPLRRDEAIKRLSKHLHTSFPGAERLLNEAVGRYIELRADHWDEYGRDRKKG